MTWKSCTSAAAKKKRISTKRPISIDKQRLTSVFFCARKDVISIRTPISWVGNKTAILPVIYSRFPLQYDRYIEPFGGSGAVLLGTEKPDKFEVYNDYNKNLVNLFRCMRERPMAFIRELGFLTLNARDDFTVIKDFFKKEEFNDRFLSEEMELTKIMLPELRADELMELQKKSVLEYDLRRAVMFLKLLRYSYSSGGKSFASQPFSVATLFSLINKLSRRMEYTVIENQDFEVLINHYDRPSAFFYSDPPYVSSEYMYECGFGWDDHLRLNRVLKSIQGKCLVSYNDCPEVQELYKDFYKYSFTRVHSMAQKYEAGKEFPEILIANYDMSERERSLPYQLTF